MDQKKEKLVKQKSDVNSDKIEAEKKRVVKDLQDKMTSEKINSQKEIFMKAAADFEKARLDKSVESTNFRSEATAKATQIAKP